jgi:hypothetical protein
MNFLDKLKLLGSSIGEAFSAAGSGKGPGAVRAVQGKFHNALEADKKAKRDKRHG